MSYNQNMLIRQVEPEDFESWYQMRVALWPDATQPEDIREMHESMASDVTATFVAQAAAGQLVGFLEAGIRLYADGCLTRNVGYIEGWYIEPAFRRQGVGAALVQAAEEWATARGCREMASDCLLGNEVSLAAHLALGYEEKERLIHFAKTL